MPSTYSTSLGLELIGNGEQAGTWGTTTNTNLGTLLEQAIAGVQSITLTGNYTLTEEEFAAWGFDNEYVAECVASAIGVTILSF